MKRTAGWMSALLVGLVLAPAQGLARGLGIELWTDRGSDAVYQPGDVIQIKTRASDDAYLLVYEIDSEGYVRVLYPFQGSNGFVEGRTTYHVPPDNSGVDLVVEQPTGQGYLVAIASRDPFEHLPWYLRPYNPQAEGVGYVGKADDEEGVTSEGRIVGDPFVQMERIRRRVVDDPNDRDAFATAYTTYYVHEQVRYPRYLCYDCHRPNRWAWWDGFDPYYTTCSVFDFRVNWSWGWGPTYWFGYVPYYCYVPRPNCPPRYRYSTYYSSWDGWPRFSGLWGGHLTRYRTPPPKDYTPPGKEDWNRRWNDGHRAPPGILVSDVSRGRSGIRPGLPIGRGGEDRLDGSERLGNGVIRRGNNPDPGPGRPRDEGNSGRGDGDGRGRVLRPDNPSPPDQRPDVERPRDERPPPREERPREGKPRHEAPPPRVEKPREEKPQSPDPPKEERSHEDKGGSQKWGGGARPSRGP